MPNRLLSNEEVNALFRDVGVAPPPHATPSVQPPDTLTREAWEQALASAPWQMVRRGTHCWHVPRAWQGSTVQAPVPRLCCWCGAREAPQHGPYAPEGGR